MTLRSLAKWAIALIAFCALLELLELGALWMQVALLGRIADHVKLEPGEAAANDARIGGLAIAARVAFLVSGVTFLRWFYRAYANLAELGVQPRHPASATVWAFAIPCVNLVRPYELMKEIRDASVPRTERRSPSYIWWWSSWIGMNVLTGVSLQMLQSAGSKAASLIDATLCAMAGSALGIASAVLAILVIRELTEAQTSTFRRDIATKFD